MNKRTTRGELVALAHTANLSADNASLTIQVIRAGDFTDMHGHDLEITSADLDAYVANSNARLASEQIPVEIGHPDDPGAPAAAWYKRFFKQAVNGIEWVCAEIELTTVGADALAKNLYKYFSANLLLGDKLIEGGGFVNRPAVSGQQAVGTLAAFLQPKPHTAPEKFRALLKRALRVLQLEMSQEEKLQKIFAALREKYSDPLNEVDSGVWVRETFDDRVIVDKDGELYAVPYTFEGDAVVLGEPVQVDVEYVPQQTNSDTTGGESSMDQAQMTAAIDAARAEERAKLAAQQQEFETKLAAARADERERVLAEQKRANDIRELSEQLTRGPKAFWHKPEDLAALLGKLTDDDRAIVAALLKDIQAKGLVDLGEHGTQQDGAQLSALPKFAERALSQWLEKDGNTVVEFFNVNSELGAMEQYDLTAFAKSA